MLSMRPSLIIKQNEFILNKARMGSYTDDILLSKCQILYSRG